MNDSTEPDRVACARSDRNEEKSFGSGTWNEVTKIFRDLAPVIRYSWAPDFTRRTLQRTSRSKASDSSRVASNHISQLGK